MDTESDRQAVFLSVSEAQKARLARPFRDLLAPKVSGLIVADLPLVGDAYSPEEKVDAYLERSQAVVVFATADVDTGTDRYTRPNIADEIGRARSKPHLRNRICVLKQAGVTLPSNTNPAYNSLDPESPAPAFRAAIEQLKAWGFNIEVPAVGSNAAVADPPVSAAEQPAESEADALRRAAGHLPMASSASGETSLSVVVVTVPRAILLRPAELEEPGLAAWLEREALFGAQPVLERGEGTVAAVRGNSVRIEQPRAAMSLYDDGTVVVTRALAHGTDRHMALRGIIEEEVLADLEADLAFVDAILSHVDPDRRTANVVPMAAIVGPGYTAWRTRAEHAASPNSMTMNVSGHERVVVSHPTPAQPRSSLSEGRPALARDLMVLLRREALQTFRS